MISEVLQSREAKSLVNTHKRNWRFRKESKKLQEQRRGEEDEQVGLMYFTAAASIRQESCRAAGNNQTFRNTESENST